MYIGGEQMAKSKKSKLNVKRIVVSLVAVYVVCHLVVGAGNILELKSQQKALKEDLEILMNVTHLQKKQKKNLALKLKKQLMKS